MIRSGFMMNTKLLLASHWMSVFSKIQVQRASVLQLAVTSGVR